MIGGLLSLVSLIVVYAILLAAVLIYWKRSSLQLHEAIKSWMNNYNAVQEERSALEAQLVRERANAQNLAKMLDNAILIKQELRARINMMNAEIDHQRERLRRRKR